MRPFTNLRLPFLAACAGIAIAVIGCSNNSSQNPVDQMTGASGRFAMANGLALSANPQNIVINPDDPNTPRDPENGDKQYGETALTVVATDESGTPQADLDITFGAAAGKLASNGVPVKTNAEGVATDTLRVYADDPNSIEVSAGDGTRVSAITVTKVVAEPPVANAGTDQTVECTGNSQAAVHLSGSASTDPNNDIVLYEWFENFGAANQLLLGTGPTLTVDLGLGTHTITLQVTDATDRTATDEVVIQVVDTTPPKVWLRPNPAKLWPPNHKLVDVHLDVRVDDCGPYTVSLESVTSNESDNGLGDGDTAGDIQGVAIGTADSDLRLRAERSGGGSGRVYTVVYKVVDAAGLETIATAWITVPHDQSGH
jgi:hypothetical protein